MFIQSRGDRARPQGSWGGRAIKWNGGWDGEEGPGGGAEQQLWDFPLNIAL